MKLCEVKHLRHPGHSAVFVHNLADHTGGMQTCEPGEIDRALSLTRPLQYASRLGPERKDMPGTCYILGFGFRIDCGKDSNRPVMGRDAGSDAFLRLDRHSEGGAEG